MAELFLLSQAQMGQIELYFRLSHGIERVGDRRNREHHRLHDQEQAALAGRAA